ncbi:MAG: hypothetical protein HC788_14925 [Sphingopyxis sp.]|nr:hypothetical protein [Sphingopyxis sp.]
MRHRALITAMLVHLLERPLPDNARSASAILHAAVAQIAFLRVPDSAAVNLAVAAAQADPQAKRYAGLVNAVMRRMAREHLALRAELAPTVDEAPQWLLAALTADYGADTARAILAAHATEPPLDLSVKADPQVWADALDAVLLPTGTCTLGP